MRAGTANGNGNGKGNGNGTERRVNFAVPVSIPLPIPVGRSRFEPPCCYLARPQMRPPLIAALLLSFAALADDKPDLAVVNRIKSAAFQDGKVMDHLFWLTEANGPRLTWSPGYRRAADWAVNALKGMGAQKAHLEKWGPPGRGWQLSRASLRLVEPVAAELVGVPKAWSSGTTGPVTAEPIVAPLFQRYERDLSYDHEALAAHLQQYIARWRGKLHGRIVLRDPLRDLAAPADKQSTRYDDPELSKNALAPEHSEAQPWEWPLKRVPRDAKERAALFAHLPNQVVFDWWQEGRKVYQPLWDFYAQEGVAAIFSTDDRGDGGTVFTESTNEWSPERPLPPPAVVLAPESYDRLIRLVQHKLPVKVELDVQVQTTAQEDGLNVIAELPGGKKKDEVVMMGAHLDSWHAGTGATDNAAGCAVMMEAFRILKALDLPLDRTVRLALWSGEEQGLFGSRGYVKEHFADPVSMQLKPEHARLAAYFNLDNGGGKVRGVWLQENDMVRPIFEQWLAPFRDEGATSLSIRNTGGTDHLSFDMVGLPGFQFIQDPLDYSTRTHHSALDVYDHVNPADLMQAAAVVASFIYDAANRPEPLPRKPLPRALPPRTQESGH